MKIIIVGAGLAGLSSAINACKDGHEVQLFERSKQCGKKVCGEALAGEALDFVGLAPSKSFIDNIVKGFILSYKGKFIRQADFKESATAPGYIVDKPALQKILLDKAEKGGATITTANVRRVDPTKGEVTLENGKSYRGDLVVCADGVGSLARKHLDYSRYEFTTCLQYKCALTENVDPNYLYLDIIGEGYLWTFPKHDCVNIGIGMQDATSLATLRNMLDRHIQKLGSKPIEKLAAAPVSVGGPISCFGTGKLVVAGESAGCVMPLSGEGNRFGMYAGTIAYGQRYRERFMAKYGNNMLRAKRMIEIIKGLTDRERVDLIRLIDDPLKLLEGKQPRILKFLVKPRLLAKLALSS